VRANRSLLTLGAIHPLLGAGLASTALASPAQQTSAPLLQVANNPTYGPILVNGTGLTLYTLASESDGKIICKDDCLGFWPPVLISPGSSTPSIGPGVTGTIGTVTRPDGTIQATRNLFPLYTFSGDGKPGDTSGNRVVAFGGTWKLVQISSGATATPTTVALAVHVKLAAKKVKAGQRQTAIVTTEAGANVSLTVSFPNKHQLHHSATANSSGKLTWHFKEPKNASKGKNHTVKVSVRVQDASGETAQASVKFTAS
jgi:predicted lipoprotein with Yx(FWY)xxD motif